MEPFATKELAAKGDFAGAARYKNFLDVLSELDTAQSFTMLKATV